MHFFTYKQYSVHTALCTVYSTLVFQKQPHFSGAHDRLMDFIDNLNRKSLPDPTACAGSIT